MLTMMFAMKMEKVNGFEWVTQRVGMESSWSWSGMLSVGLHCASSCRTPEQQGRKDDEGEGKGQRLAVDAKSDL
jgi:hypothetical protein